MKRVYIITGAKGHLASTIIRYLRKENCHIRGLILPSENGEDDLQVTFYKGDVSKFQSLEEIFSNAECNEVVVIHTAGMISIDKEVSSRMYQVNVEGTKNVIAQCLRHHVKRLVYVSSVHAIPERTDGRTISEIDHFSKDKVTGAYAATKAEATQAVLDACNSGLEAVVVQPSGIVGPYDNGNNYMVQMIKMCISGKLPAGVAGGYDFVDVRDVAKGCLAAADCGKPGNSYILSNRYVSIREILEYVRNVTGGRKKICLPICFAYIIAPIFREIAKAKRIRPLYTEYALHTLAGNEHFSHEKATRELDYQPRELETTITDTVTWLKGEDVSLEIM